MAERSRRSTTSSTGSSSAPRSVRELQATRTRTEGVIAAMRRSEQRIDPVLRPLRDRVLFLKHNLNAKALGALTSELTAVEGNVDSLIAELQTAIAEADAYLAEMEQARTSRRTVDGPGAIADLLA